LHKKVKGAVQKVRVTDFLEPLIFSLFKKNAQKNRPF